MISKIIPDRKIENFIYRNHLERLKSHVQNNNLNVDYLIDIIKILNMITVEFDTQTFFYNPEARIHSDKIKQKIGSNKYKHYIDTLIMLGIISVNPLYIPGNRSKQYFVHTFPYDDIIPLSNILEQLYNYKYKSPVPLIERQKELTKSVKKIHNMIYNNDIEGYLSRDVIEFLHLTDDEYNNFLKFTIHYTTTHSKKVNDLYTQNITTGRNDSNRRFNSNVTAMHTELREWLMAEREYTYIDVVNCQPYLLGYLLNGISNPIIDELNLTTAPEIASDELSLYNGMATSGNLYESYMEIVLNKTGISITRNDAKLAFYSILFAPNSTWNNSEIKLFNDSFPTIGRFINWMKTDKYLYVDALGSEFLIGKRAQQLFAILLQRIESNIIIDTVCPLLYENGVSGIITVHDAIAIPHRYANITFDIFYNSFDEIYKPILDTKHYSKNNFSLR